MDKCAADLTESFRTFEYTFFFSFVENFQTFLFLFGLERKNFIEFMISIAWLAWPEMV